MSNNKRILLLLVLIFSVYAMSYEPVEALPFDFEETNRTLTAGQWYYYSDYYYSTDTVNVYLETDTTAMLVDFFICDAANYTSWSSIESGTGFGVEFDVHTNYFSFDVPDSGTWYIVVSNRYGSSTIYVDISVDVNEDNRPHYSSSTYDFWTINYEVLENDEWYYVTDTLSAGTEISGHFSTYFSTDGVDFFIVDEDDYSDWASGSSVSAYGLIEDYHISSIPTFTIPYTDTWYFVFSAVDQVDAVTLSLGLAIDTSGVIDTETNATGVEMFGLIGAIGGLIGLLVFLLILNQCCCKKRREDRRELQPSRGFAPPSGGFGDSRSADNVVLGALKSYPRISMKELADILKMPVDQVRRTTLKLIGTGVISGTFDRRSDEFTSITATEAGRELREDAMDAFALPRCPNCSAPLSKPLLAGETIECPNCGTWVTG